MAIKVSNTTVIDDSRNITNIGTLNVGTGGTVITTTGIGSVGIGTTNPTQKLDVDGGLRLRGALYDTSSLAGSSGQILKSTGSAIQWIDANTTNVGSANSIAITLDNTNLPRYLTFVSSTSNNNVVYADTELLYNPSTNTLGINTTSFTGTSNQNLQITGGAYVSGNLGIGSTTPISKLTVQGDVLVSGVVTATSFRGDGSQLSGVTGTQVVSQPFTSTPVYPILASNSGVSSVGIATTNPNSLVFIPSTGNLGIGSTTPTSKLTVQGDVLVSGIVTANSFRGDGSQLSGVTGTQVVSQPFTSTPVYPILASNSGVSSVGIATTGSTALVFIPSTGSLGIGTTNPRANLDVTSSILVSTGVASTAGFLIKSYTTNNGTLSFEDVDNTNPRFSIDRDTSYLFKVNDTTFATKLVVNNSGNLGVGTTVPTSKLHVIGDVNVTGILTANRLISNVYGEYVGATSLVGFALSISGISTFSNGPVFIGAATSTGTANQRLQVTGGAYVSGNLGIGTTNPRANLDVTSSILVSTGVAQTAGFLIKSYTNSSGLISFEDVDNTNSRFSIDRDTSYLFKVNDTTFATRLVVNNSGNLGVGTTNPTSKLHVIGDVNVTGILTASRLVSNLYGEYVGATSLVGFALSVSGISTFSNGPVFIGSGTSTGTASQRLQVTGGAYVSGNLGIGTTNPRANLDVINSILVSPSIGSTTGFLIKSYTTDNGTLSFENADNTYPRFSIDKDASYLFKVNDTSFATKLIINNSGDVGVGTTNPTSKLHIIGNVNITGSLTKGSGTFVIPHPILQDKNLVHSFVESPRADLIYRGVSPMVNGIATVIMDEYIGLTTGTWKLLCREPQIFLQNNSDFSLVKGNIDDDGVLTIISNTSSNCNIDWMVVSERQDEVIKNANWTDDNGKPILEPYK